MRNIVKCLVLVSIILVSFSIAKAEVPKLITIQGRLLDSSNQPITIATQVNFSVFNSYTSGSMLWSEIRSVTPDDNGVFFILLGSAKPLDVNFNIPTYLQVSVNNGATWENLVPRYNLTSLPYGFRGMVAENVSSSNRIYIQPENTLAGSYFGGSGLTQYLSLTGDAMVGGAITAGPASGGRHLIINDIVGARWSFNTGGYDLAIQNDYPLGTWGTKILIDENGNVGIGTVTANVRLNVSGRIRSGGYPADDVTPDILSTFELRNRGSGGGDYIWRLYTAAVGGGFGVNPNSFEVWEYPQDATPGCCISRFKILESGSQAIAPGEVVIDRDGNLRVTKLASCNTIDTDASGNLRCGTDETGGGTGTVTSIGAGAGLVSSTTDPITTSGTLNIVAGQGITVNADNVQIKDCAADQILKRNPADTDWVCASDAGITSESDTLQTVTNRGSITTNPISIDDWLLVTGRAWVEGNHIISGQFGADNTRVDLQMYVATQNNRCWWGWQGFTLGCWNPGVTTPDCNYVYDFRGEVWWIDTGINCENIANEGSCNLVNPGTLKYRTYRACLSVKIGW